MNKLTRKIKAKGYTLPEGVKAMGISLSTYRKLEKEDHPLNECLVDWVNELERKKMTELKFCCGERPIVFVPATWGNKQIDETLMPSVECGNCERACYGNTQDQAFHNWNSIEHLEYEKND